ncbi:MAG: tRNA (N6-threonylcarbamoyladenosine(37)-N6)-methyltransferase TrmO [Armatimonadetes bacterium CG07_land_8_20_14_0_80_40_9]|nr:MAG: tRNA (N6-threonylcarbamoyladenosine(37)-N6)-methyltransferase TrmO [Armatimonadetes bacterium CG07_land_8_20_14_0_80_40_9]
MQDYLLKPIGVVRSNYKEASLTLQDQDLELNQEILTKTKTGKGSISELIIKEEYKDCLDGIEDFSHIMVLYWSHLINEEKRYVTKVHPAGKQEYPLVGVFATRSPVRPNPICVTTVELLERKENVLKVKSLDALDGSPIIDIKFHHPSYDAPSNVKLASWMEELINYFREKLK